MPADKNSSDTSSNVSLWQSVARVSYVGIFFGVAVTISWLGGHYIEKKWGGAPWPSLAGVLLGVVAGFRELYRVAKAAQRDLGDG